MKPRENFHLKEGNVNEHQKTPKLFKLFLGH